jgi:hypothetical protein
MTASTLRKGTGKELRRLFALMSTSIGETLGSLVSKPIVVRPAQTEIKAVDAFVAGLPRPYAVARGSLDKAFAGKSMLTLIELPDAIAMAGLLMMTPDDVIAQRRTRGTLGDEDTQAFGELGNVLCSGLGNVLREQVGNVDVRYQDHGTVAPGADGGGVLGTGELFLSGFRMKIGGYPESTGTFAIDVATAEAWNKAPLELDVAPAGTSVVAGPPAASLRDDELLDDTPAAPIRGAVAAFVQHGDAFRVLRRSCRRVGLDLRRHGRTEIPNPAAHKNGIVLLDVLPGEERRFDWCRRIKEMSDSTRVVVLLHHPSRQRVTQAFLSRADVIVGFPCEEHQLSQKLAALLATDEPPAT